MALSNWDTLSVNEKGESTQGEFTSPLGVSVELYKNWIYVRDEKAWQEGGNYVQSCVMEIQEGRLTYKDVHILALRGPQEGIFVVAWVTKYGKDVTTTTGMVGCGVYGYEDHGDFVGVKPETVKWLVDKLNAQHEETYTVGDTQVKELDYDIDVPDELRKIDLSKAARFNQGDAYFAEHIGTPTQATAPGEAKPTVMSQVFTGKSET